MMPDKNENPVNRLLENPVFYVAGAVIAIIASLMGWFDSTFLLIILPAAAFGTYRWYQKRNA
jgi:hypothetical protein